jgi:hypothetical protein
MIAEAGQINSHVCEVARAVIERGSREVIRAWLGASEDTIGRMMTTRSAGRWTEPRLDALQRYEEVTLGTRTIRNARLATLETERVGHPENVERDLSQDIGVKAAFIGRENGILAAGATLWDLKALLPDLDAEIEALRQERADIMSRIRQLEGRA